MFWARLHARLGVVSLVDDSHFLLVPAVVRVVAVSLVERPLLLVGTRTLPQFLQRLDLLFA